VKRVVAFLICWCAATPDVLLAQPAQPPRSPQTTQALPGKVELAVGGRWLLPHGVDSEDARATTPGGSDFVLFNTESEMGGTPALEVRVGFRLTRRVWLAFGGSYGWTSLDTRVTDDVEDVSDVTVSGTATEFTAGGMMLIELGRQPRRGRWVPLLFVGGDYLRDVPEDGFGAESGMMIHTGMAFDLHLGSFAVPRPASAKPRALKDLALRLEGRLALRSGCAIPDDSLHIAPGIGVLIAFRY
jgi:hypothetical protein